MAFDDFEKAGPLVVAKSFDSTRVGNTDFVKQAAGLDLPETGERFEDRKHFRFSDDLIGVARIENFTECKRTHLEAVLQFGAGLSGNRSLY